MKKIINTVLSFIVLAIATLPLDTFLVVKNYLSPQGFWQQFVVYGVGIWLLGGLEIGMLAVSVVVILGIWTDWANFT